MSGPTLVVPLLTPVTADGAPDAAAIGRLVDFVVSAGADGLFCLGSTGSFPMLGPADRTTVIRVAREAAGGRVPVWAGVGEAGTRLALERVDDACDAGADAVVTVAPYYLRVDDAGLRQHFLAVLDHSAVPVFIYNIPILTGATVTPSLLAELAAHPRCGGLKDSSSDIASFLELQRAVRDVPGFATFQGDERLVAPAMFLGASGAVLGLANLAPELCREIVDAGLAQDREAALVAQGRLLDLFDIVGLGDFRRLVHYALSLRGVDVAEPPLPSPPLTDDARRQVRAILHGLDLI